MINASDWQEDYNKYIMEAPEWETPKLDAPATEKQVKYLKILGVPEENIPYSKDACREMISHILNEEENAKSAQGDYEDEAEFYGLSYSDLC